MKNIINRLNKVEFYKDTIFYIFLIVSILFFGMLIKFEFATDTYAVFTIGGKSIFNHFLSNGRIITAITYAIAYKLHLSEYIVYLLSYLSGVILITASMYKLFKIINDKINSSLIPILICILTIINIFSIELFLYIEKGILVLSIFACVIALEYLTRYFKKGKNINLFVSFISMMFSYMCYQGTVGIFVSLGTVFIVMYSKNIRNFIKNNIITALLYGIPAIANILIIKLIFTNGRTNGEIILSESIIKIKQGTLNMLLTTYNLFPKYLYAIAILIVICFSLFKIFTCKEYSKKIKLFNILSIIYIVLVNLIVTLLPQLMQNTNSIWFVSRSTYTFASLLGILLLYLYATFEVNIKINKIISILCITYLFIQFNYFIKIEKDRYINNYIDNQIAQEIVREINDYERKTGNVINKIAIYKDKNSSYAYPNLFVTGDMNIRAFNPEWSAVNIINYFMGRKIEITSNNENINKKFKENDWNYYSKDQLIFDYDTIHLCVF